MSIHAAGRRAVTVVLGLAALVSPTAGEQATGVPSAAPAPAPVPAEDEPVIVAHRGASGRAPENTLAAARAAARLGVTWVETDVQRTADGVLVLMHDGTLERTTDAEERYPDRAPWNVADFTAEEIARLDAGGWFGPGFAGEPVPTLADLLELLDAGGQRLLLEIKDPERYPGIEEDILAELGAAGWLAGGALGERLVVQSFSAASVRTVHDLAPGVKTGLLGAPAMAELDRHAAYADQINPDQDGLTAEYVAAVHALAGPHGMPLEVTTWTVNDAARARAVARLGVDGIISDVPDVVRHALGGRPGQAGQAGQDVSGRP